MLKDALMHGQYATLNVGLSSGLVFTAGSSEGGVTILLSIKCVTERKTFHWLRTLGG